MRIYIASSFSLIAKVEVVAKALEDAGHDLICKWWTGLDYIPWERRTLKDYAQSVSPDEFYAHPACRNAFERDYKGVKDAEVFLLVAADEPRAYNGANIELGIALGDGKPCYSLGRLDNSALYYPVRRAKSIGELVELLGGGGSPGEAKP